VLPSAMIIATWNVNSIRARQERLERWLAKRRPDVLCLQELKVVDDQFPLEILTRAGYHSAVLGQKTYNGVAILTRNPSELIGRGLDDGTDDPQARLIAVRTGGIEILCAYVPNGAEVGSDKWEYKIQWLHRLRSLLDKRHRPDQPLILCGDLNVAPEPRDVHDPAAWEATVLFHPDARAALAGVTTWGLLDAFRLHHSEAGLYSWWDYRMLAFPKNRGLRIDHVLITEPLRERCLSAWIDRDERKGKLPSDHAPVVVELAD
jgi:exodeoxyribonuclease III